MTAAWGALLVAQLELYWDMHLRPRLDGLTDEECPREPADGCPSLRRDADRGHVVLDGRQPEPSPAPVTTIACRLIHVAIGLSTRTSAFVGDGKPTAALAFMSIAT